MKNNFFDSFTSRILVTILLISTWECIIVTIHCCPERIMWDRMLALITVLYIITVTTLCFYVSRLLKKLLERENSTMLESYYNQEDDDMIICPYCGEKYKPSYEDTYIGGECVDCYTEEEHTYTCDNCNKQFTMYGYQSGWCYCTETIEGQMTEKEHKEYEK